MPASQGAPQAEKATTQTAAAAAPAAGSGAEAGAAALGGASGAPGAGEGLFNADPAIREIALGDSPGAARGPSAATLPVLQSPDTPRLVAMQIAEVVRASGERAVELRLQPEELGRVQLTMSQDATGTLTVSLNVERPETLDLLRRNIDLLSADLHDLGYESIDFSFQGDGADTQKDARPERGDGPATLDADGATNGGNLPQTGVRGASASGDGIDIRL
jgi:flagellar hook-length control protein FliK